MSERRLASFFSKPAEHNEEDPVSISLNRNRQVEAQEGELHHKQDIDDHEDNSSSNDKYHGPNKRNKVECNYSCDHILIIQAMLNDLEKHEVHTNRGC